MLTPHRKNLNCITVEVMTNSKKKTTKWLSWMLIIFLIVAFLLGRCVKSINTAEEEVIPVKLQQPEFFLQARPDSTAVMQALLFYDIKHPEIVFAQAVLETGYFKSPIMVEYNNLFGLYDSNKKDYFRFNHWAYSVAGYRDFIQYKWNPPENYYTFLQRIGYAEDSLYLSKIKYLTKNNYIWLKN